MCLPSKIASGRGTRKCNQRQPQVSRQIRRRFHPFHLSIDGAPVRSAQEEMAPQRPTHRVTPKIVCFSSFCRLLVQQCHYCSLAGRGVPRGPVAGLLEECWLKLSNVLPGQCPDGRPTTKRSLSKRMNVSWIKVMPCSFYRPRPRRPVYILLLVCRKTLLASGCAIDFELLDALFGLCFEIEGQTYKREVISSSFRWWLATHLIIYSI